MARTGRPQFRQRPQASAAIGDLVAPFPVGMGPDEDRHLLPMLFDRGNERAVLFSRPFEAVGDGRCLDQFRGQFGDGIGAHLLDRAGDGTDGTTAPYGGKRDGWAGFDAGLSGELTAVNSSFGGSPKRCLRPIRPCPRPL